MFIGFPATVAIECFERVFLKDLPTDWSFTDIGLLDDFFFSAGRARRHRKNVFEVAPMNRDELFSFKLWNCEIHTHK